MRGVEKKPFGEGGVRERGLNEVREGEVKIRPGEIGSGWEGTICVRVVMPSGLLGVAAGEGERGGRGEAYVFVHEL